jgi:hypothetical protein
MPLEVPEGSASVKLRGNRLKLIPPLDAAMGCYRAFDVESGHDIGDGSTVPIVQSDRRHFKSIGRLCVPGAFHAADQIEFARVDVLTLPIDDRLVVNVNQQNLPQDQAEATQPNFLHQRAFHRNRRLRNAGNFHPFGRCEIELGLLRLFDPFWKRDRGDPHFLSERERYKIDDKLLVGANV